MSEGRDRPEDKSVAASPAPGSSRRWLRWLVPPLALLLSVGVWLLADWWICLPDDAQATYVGRGSCVECHAPEVEQWTGSDHDRAMDLATDDTVLGDFDDVEFTHNGLTSRFFRDGRKFMVHTEGPDGQMADFEIKYTFGVRPLQQYMVEFDRPADMPAHEIARLQILRISWDTVRGRWFDCPPHDARERLSPDDPMHWTGISQCWNYMCAYCHSTNLQKNYDVATGIYHTTFSEIDVSCEACHGPASLHVQLARSRSWFWDRKRGYGLVRLKGADTRPEIESCAPCHSRRQVLQADYRPGDQYYDYFNNELLAETTYYADGQIMDEVYEYGSFLQSKMYHQDIRCSDCHNPHSMRLKQDGNGVCTACHQHPAAKYDTPAHHFHQSDSTGASCAECHMPETTYMEVDARRDHSLRIPRPDLSVALGTPNACTRCHLSDAKISEEKRAALQQYRDWIEAARRGDAEIQAELARLDQWMLESMQTWYRKETWDESLTFARALDAGRRRAPDAEAALATVAADRRLPGIARATAIFQRGALREISSLQPELAALTDPDPQVRTAAVTRFFGYFAPRELDLPPDYAELAAIRQRAAPVLGSLVPLLNDPRRAVRAETGRVLAQLPQQLVSELLSGRERRSLDRAIDEYIDATLQASDRGGAHLELGSLFESLGRLADAEQAYRTAVRVEPRMAGPRSNLAGLLERICQHEEAGAAARGPSAKVVGLREEIRRLRREELDLLARDARLVPEDGLLQYRYGLALYQNGMLDQAEQALRAACRLEPDNDQFLFFLAVFLDNYHRYDEALETVDRAVQLRPRDPQYLQLRNAIRAKQRQPARK